MTWLHICMCWSLEEIYFCAEYNVSFPIMIPWMSPFIQENYFTAFKGSCCIYGFQQLKSTINGSKEAIVRLIYFFLYALCCLPNHEFIKKYNSEKKYITWILDDSLNSHSWLTNINAEIVFLDGKNLKKAMHNRGIACYGLTDTFLRILEG